MSTADHSADMPLLTVGSGEVWDEAARRWRATVEERVAYWTQVWDQVFALVTPDMTKPAPRLPGVGRGEGPVL